MTLYKVGKIVNTHGIRGEVKVITTTDFVEERFQVGNQLWIEQAGQAPIAVTIKQARPHKGTMYYRQIIGLKVQTIDGRSLGTIKEILAPGANDVWVVQREGQSDLLLPVIDDVIKKVDLDAGLVTVELLEGLE